VKRAGTEVLDVNEERLYMAEWKRRQQLHGGRRVTLLELLLQPDDHRGWVLTQRDAHVAACVIQWLGTNCGGGFINKVEESIDRARTARDSKIFDRLESLRPCLATRRRLQMEEARKKAEAEAVSERQVIADMLERERQRVAAELELARAENERLSAELLAERNAVLEYERARADLLQRELDLARTVRVELESRTRMIDVEEETS
jgi:hypothetical protein